MGFAALNFFAFSVAEVVGEQAALRLDDEVQALGPVFLDEHGPVGVVGA